ncbi:MAG TPA: alternative ribosome rescue aminoacyl-tRNA hydrolase ArfB [Armatimonadota bacterium]|nr:alternative ribosome rescue aminoacyl-tRNA hydrolase ArfB [Armatimonadota bacterium]
MERKNENRSEAEDSSPAHGIEIARGSVIPPDEIEWRFSRSTGPGGQNVNKVETRVEIIFRPQSSRAFSEYQRALIMERLSSRLDSAGALHLVSAASRSQRQNRDAALRRLQDLLRDALRPRRARTRTRVPAAQRAARLQSKRRRGEIKQTRTFRRGADEIS